MSARIAISRPKRAKPVMRSIDGSAASSASSGIGPSHSNGIHTAAAPPPAGRSMRPLVRPSWPISMRKRPRRAASRPGVGAHEPVEVRIDGERVGQGLHDLVEVGAQADHRRLGLAAYRLGVQGAQTFSAMRIAARQPARTTAASTG